jgi:nitrite reductase (NO-forming)
MKKLSLFVVFFAALSFALVSCGGDAPKAAEEEATPEQVEETVAAEPEAAEPEVMDLSAGQAIYETKCATCHQANGEGFAPSFPPLAKSDYMLADIPRAIRQSRLGSNEPITVNGVEYTTPMTPVEMTDQEVLDVMNYVLNSWGNDYGAITMDDVTAAFAE